MELADVLLRASGATLLLSLSLLLIRDAPQERTTWLFSLLALGLCGFLARNTDDPALQISGWVATAASFSSANAAIFLWWFVLGTFDDEFRLGSLELGLGGVWLAISSADRGFLGSEMSNIGLSWLLVAIGLGLVAHLMYRLLDDREGDLIEQRRRTRVLVAAALIGLLFADLALDLAFGFDWRPGWFTVGQNAFLLIFALTLCAVLLRVNQGATFLQSQPGRRQPACLTAGRPGLAENVLHEKLTQLMGTRRVYREADLTFSRFVSLLGAPEAEVRRLVNQQLGHGHFRSFLNAYRIDDAKRALLDPSRSGEKIISIAMDAGFASLASFNRAFKSSVGRSPTEFRVHGPLPARSAPTLLATASERASSSSEE